MSVTCVLVPVLEPEAEGLLEGRPDAVETAIARAGPLRTRVARVDAIREELHGVLFDRWQAANRRPPTLFDTFRRLVTKQTAATAAPDAGYDPFVHLFGRSLPADGKSPREVAARLKQLLAADDATFTQLLGDDLAGIDAKARPLWDAVATPTIDPAESLRSEAARAHAAFEARSLREALDAVVRVSAWSWPVWRFDGEMLTTLMRTLGIVLEGAGAEALFENLLEPETLEARGGELPNALGDFRGAGLFLPSTQVKVLAGALRMQRLRIAENIRTSGDAQAVLRRHVRLLEEAVLFCEAQDLALCETAGLEWHDREEPRAGR